ncbi:CPBP family intramembrane glutamic endopeptidase [Conexibacter woesei]|uniref:Abortive infection protein n=1 Tax=Conexibacter woesei (strain DSM 14684 / CCUG 47730 / CIP 108061 / JCM 11494 / NBRC 100937 / ID131577) TaxID=469383 RepID=D3F0W6_CONWI|nr:CPBP family intramembrane glutamic endopeptidase [Conexibacter woesei]ADB50042.1 Abortive infection protein [Conexibacter woesei DSM 14684]
MSDGRAAIPQWSLARILAVWAAAAVPMGVAAWVLTPLLEDRLGGEVPLAKALIVCLTAGLVWQFALVVLLVRREQGTLRWSRVRQALWLRSPHDEATGQTGGRLWAWALAFALAFALLQELPIDFPAPDERDLGAFLGTDAAERLFAGAWGWFALVALLALFNTVLGEELMFRGLLLPRMQGAFGRRDWVANGVLTGLYHLHMPWAIPSAIVAGLLFAWPSRRYESALMGIAIHSAQSIVIVGAVLALVVK